MKLSFDIQHWQGDWDELCSVAADTKMSGVELFGVTDGRFHGKSSPTNPELSASQRRTLGSLGLSIPCVTTAADLTDYGFLAEFTESVDVAVNLGSPCVCVHTDCTDKAACVEVLSSALEIVDGRPVTVLVETVGAYADTEKLRDLLNEFADDQALSACWNMAATSSLAKEDAEKTITNLGAYVHHVHVNDYRIAGDEAIPELIGEGSLPIEEMMNALRSVNYDGFISLTWDPAWLPEIDDIEIILTHFRSCMRRFRSTRGNSKHLYWNKAHTGNYVWKKESLINCTFPEVLDVMVDKFPDQTAIKFTTLDYERTYAQFRDDVDEFARALVTLGVRAGSKVTIWATNVPAWFLTFWAATKIGAVLVTMNTAYKIHEAEYLLRQSDTHTLVMIDGFKDSDYKSIINELCPELKDNKPGSPLHAKRLPFLRNVITVGFRMPGALTWEESLEYAEKTPIDEIRRMQAAIDVNDVCNMQYTSGTTGFPKGVMLTHYNIVNDGKSIGDGMDLSTADRMMIQVPMFHCFGMVLAMTATMTHGGTILPIPYFSPKSSLACINNERITAFHGVPTMFIAMLSHPDFEKTDFSHMRTGIMAGSPCPIAVMRDVVDKMHMPEIVIVYGQTEASPGCTMSRTTDPLEVRVTTVGAAFPEVECKIVDPETGEDCPDEVVGEFVARGYNIMKGYYKMPKATASAIDRDGWLHTGDLACRTPEGNYKITGRLKDMIIRGGENIYPKEIEEFIYTHPKVSDVQVIGVPDKASGEEIMACIILKEGEQMTAEEMKKFVLDHMAKHKVPKYIEFVDSFPMNDAGKIQKYKMREWAVEKLGLQADASIETA
ncbi:MAG: AMP-binding protein [Oscillospiraceae bacterium]|nr:AMP-binding protein [Oscillospiraceae bacterium]